MSNVYLILMSFVEMEFWNQVKSVMEIHAVDLIVCFCQQHIVLISILPLELMDRKF